MAERSSSPLDAIYDALYDESKGLHIRRSSTGAAAPNEMSRLLDSIPGNRIARQTRELSVAFRALSPQQRLARYSTTVFRDIWHASPLPGSNGDEHSRLQTEFMFRLATAPATIRNWSQDLLEPSLQFMVKHNAYAKTTRYLALSVDYEFHGPQQLGDSTICRGWEWV